MVETHNIVRARVSSHCSSTKSKSVLTDDLTGLRERETG